MWEKVSDAIQHAKEIELGPTHTVVCWPQVWWVVSARFCQNDELFFILVTL